MKNPTEIQALGLRIRKLRKELNISQEELGLRANVTELTIQRVELAKFGCSIDNLISIAKALNLKISDLFDFE